MTGGMYADEKIDKTVIDAAAKSSASRGPTNGRQFCSMLHEFGDMLRSKFTVTRAADSAWLRDKVRQGRARRRPAGLLTWKRRKGYKTDGRQDGGTVPTTEADD